MIRTASDVTPAFPRLETDGRFCLTAALTGRFTEHFTPHPNQPDIGHWFSLDHTLSMQPGKARLPKPTIN